MRLSDLYEAPLMDISFHGDENASGFSNRDIALMKKYVGDGTYVTKLAKTDVRLYVYILHDKDLGFLGQTFPEGFLFRNGSLDWKHENAMVNKALKSAFTAELLEKIESVYHSDPKAIQFIMGDNFAGDVFGQIAPTPWILLHRLAHCFELNGIMAYLTAYHASVLDATEVGDKMPRSSRPTMSRQFQTHLGQLFNIKSLKDGKVVDSGEIPAELATRYMLTGPLSIDESAYEGMGLSATNLMLIKIHANALAKLVNSVVSKAIKAAEGTVSYI